MAADNRKQVERAIDTYRSAVLAKNAETFMHLYAPEVRVFDTWGIWSYEGAQAWRVAVEGWFSSLGSETVRVTFEDVAIDGDGGFAVIDQSTPTRAAHTYFNQTGNLMATAVDVTLGPNATPTSVAPATTGVNEPSASRRWRPLEPASASITYRLPSGPNLASIILIER